jgi:hypothetical protein
MIKEIWYDGIDNYKKNTITEDPINNKRTYCLELLDAPVKKYYSIFECYSELLSTRQTKYVDVLFSGGLDSELILHCCLHEKIPVRAITMRLLIHDCPMNLPDLYFSEKFCRLNNIEQIIIDLDVNKFFDEGKPYDYLGQYKIIEPHVATHFWLFEQCSGFPIIGGDYTWPWVFKPLLSPHRYSYAMYDKFLKDSGIHGIGNMMGHSISSNMFFMSNHIELQKKNTFKTDFLNIPKFKKALWEQLGYSSPELRFRSYGWEYTPKFVFDLAKYREEMIECFGETDNQIIWNDTINSLIGAEIKFNDRFR